MSLEVIYNTKEEKYELECSEVDLGFLPTINGKLIDMDGDDIESWMDEIYENYLRIRRMFCKIEKDAVLLNELMSNAEICKMLKKILYVEVGRNF